MHSLQKALGVWGVCSEEKDRQNISELVLFLKTGGQEQSKMKSRSQYRQRFIWTGVMPVRDTSSQVSSAVEEVVVSSHEMQSFC